VSGFTTLFPTFKNHTPKHIRLSPADGIFKKLERGRGGISNLRSHHLFLYFFLREHFKGFWADTPRSFFFLPVDPTLVQSE
jgi:hypothetical protein